MNAQIISNIKDSICTIPNYPKPGIMFRDVTSLMQNHKAFQQAVDCLTEPYINQGITKVVGAEARGFIFGACVANKLNAGFIPARKPNKLPRKTVSQAYQLEYGEDELHIHDDAFCDGDKVLLVDDLLATGGTIEAVAKLVQDFGVEIVAAAFVVTLPELGGEDVLKRIGLDIHTLISFDGE